MDNDELNYWISLNRATRTNFDIFSIWQKAVKIGDMSLGDHKDMLRSCRMDVLKSHEALVLSASKHKKEDLFTMHEPVIYSMGRPS